MFSKSKYPRNYSYRIHPYSIHRYSLQEKEHYYKPKRHALNDFCNTRITDKYPLNAIRASDINNEEMSSILCLQSYFHVPIAELNIIKIMMKEALDKILRNKDFIVKTDYTQMPLEDIIKYVPTKYKVSCRIINMTYYSIALEGNLKRSTKFFKSIKDLLHDKHKKMVEDFYPITLEINFWAKRKHFLKENKNDGENICYFNVRRKKYGPQKGEELRIKINLVSGKHLSNYVTTDIFYVEEVLKKVKTIHASFLHPHIKSDMQYNSLLNNYQDFENVIYTDPWVCLIGTDQNRGTNRFYSIASSLNTI
jgi:hypothetical protein